MHAFERPQSSQMFATLASQPVDEIDRRFLLPAELDAAFFHLYGVNRNDADYILDTFPIVRGKDKEAHGEYHTKRTILEIFDAIHVANTTGIQYESVLDPAPGFGPRHQSKRH